MDTLFKIAEASAYTILYILGLLSVISVSIMIERFFALKKIGKSSKNIARDFRAVIETQNLDLMVELSADAKSLEGRAVGFGLGFVKKHGASGLDELFDSYKAI